MKILLDESLPSKLKNDFPPDHEIFSVRDMNWLGKKNGELLQLIIENKFEIFVTVDRNLPYQQNLQRLPFTIFVLCAVNNRRDTLQKLVHAIFEKINNGALQNVVEIM